MGKKYAKQYHKTKGLMLYHNGEYRTPEEIKELEKSKAPAPKKKGPKATEEEAS